MRQWLRRFRRPSDREFAAEVESHIAHETDERVDAGLSPEEARYAALRRFGNVTRHIEQFREGSRWFWLETLWQDMRYGWRSLSRSPALFGAAVVSLALAIGGTTAMVSVLHASVLDPLPFPHSGRLAALVQYDRHRAGASTAYVKSREFIEYTKLSDVFDGVAGVAFALANVNGTDEPTIEYLGVTCNFFKVLGVAAELGRTPQAADCNPAAPPVVVLSHRLWRSRFAADPNVIGRVVRFDGLHGSVPANSRLRTVIGVMPARVVYWHEDAWIPSGLTGEKPDPAIYHVVGRLHADQDYSKARARVAALSSRLIATWPTDHARDAGPFGLEPVRDQTVRQYEGTMWGLAAGVLCVLILACVNVATLLFVRATARQTEMGIRVSLGASAGRIVRQLLVESLILTSCGGLIGTVLAATVMAPLGRLVSASVTMASQAAIQINRPALLATAVTVAVASLVFGLAPALYALRRDPARALVSGSRSTGGVLGTRWRAILVAGQIALAFPVFCATTALLVSFVALQQAAGRYEPDHVLEAFVSTLGVSGKGYESTERVEQLFLDLERALAAVPGVASSASTLPVLLARIRPAVLEPTGSDGTVRCTAQLRGVSHGFFATMRVPLLRGRTFLEADQASRQRVAVISRSFARTYFRGGNGLGEHVRVTDAVPWLRRWGNEPLEIIGVVDDIPLPDGNDDAVGIVPTVYVPLTLASLVAADVLVRTTLPPRSAVRDVRRAIATVEPQLIVNTSVLRDSIERNWTAWPRLVLVVAGSFTGVGLVLVLIGVFGVLSYSIAQLSQEIGLRMALGASPAQIGRQVLWRGVRWAVLGIALGVVTTLALLAVARHQLWGLATLDSSLLGAVAAAVLVVGVGTSWIPARRAMRVDPVTVLRAE